MNETLPDPTELAGQLRLAWLSAFESHKQLAERAMRQVSDDDLHRALDPETNSIAVVAKHIAGNLKSRWTDFLTTDGEKPWRDRDDEFVDDFADRAALMQHWESGWQPLLDTLDSLTPGDLTRTIEIRGEPHTVALAAARSLAHTAYHVGQIVMIARIHAGDAWETLTIPRGQSQQFNQQQWGKATASRPWDEPNG